MRARAIVWLVLLAVPVLAGCTSQPPTHAAIALSDVAVPEGATMASIGHGVAATWSAAKLPFTTTVVLPEHATMVRVEADAKATAGIAMSNAETGRRRCNNPTVESFSQSLTGIRTCSGLTGIDQVGARWKVTVGGTGATDVRIAFLDLPVDGLLADVDLSLIDKPTLPLQQTTVQMVPSWDGTPLRVEVTLPQGPGPWPAVIESSPYHDDGVRATPASWTYFVQDWAKRGYAIVVADVRGFGDSGGCVEVWGPNEQKDQAFLVEWTAKQPFSNGHVGFYGQSYVGTTPVEAAVQHPEHLDAIIAVAPVINSYEDWHHGGVPDGENTGSPVDYQVFEDAFVAHAQSGDPVPQRTDPATLANNAANGLCDPTLEARANDPRALFDQFYSERDFKLRAHDVTAAVLYTQGFEDLNVKSDMIPGWFNELSGPKLGLFGHWIHQHPPRMDTEALMLAWVEQYVKGKDLGLARLPQVDILESATRHRTSGAWPAPTSDAVLWPTFGGDALADQPAAGSATLTLDGTGGLAGLAPATDLSYASAPLAAATSLSGVATLHGVGSLTGAGTAYIEASLYDVAPDGTAQLYAWGDWNLAHNADHTQFTPVTAADVLRFDLPLRTTEHLFPAGHRVLLVLSSALATGVPDGTGPLGLGGAQFTFLGGADGTRLVLPGIDASSYAPLPWTARA